MAEAKKVVMTYDGLKKMEQELENLKTVRRKEVAEKIKEARGQGDLSENAEYDAAKEEQGEIESRIIQLENLLRNAEVIERQRQKPVWDSCVPSVFFWAEKDEKFRKNRDKIAFSREKTLTKLLTLVYNLSMNFRRAFR